MEVAWAEAHQSASGKLPNARDASKLAHRNLRESEDYKRAMSVVLAKIQRSVEEGGVGVSVWLPDDEVVVRGVVDRLSEAGYRTRATRRGGSRLVDISWKDA